MVILPYCQQLPVTIVDLSAGGCQIRLAHPLEVPQRFDLQFRNLAYLCERRRVNGLSVGIQFLDLCSRTRRKQLSTK